ncbi:hypothetical protein ACFPM3_20545 [Streptomyces coeruleoprunus]|uniref:Uncharacterized protein n=1 Tax=Streptomyces coeruleoprunus TaxID=285563 RepID=A0ABV9XHP4_9ACTN
MKNTHETAAETDTSAVMAGRNITLDELATELSAIEVRLRQLARAAEVPATPVELADVIDSLRSTASTVRETGDRMGLLARIVDGDVPLSTRFRDSEDPWGVAARGTDRPGFGGPAIVPTVWQLLRLAHCDSSGTRVTGRSRSSTSRTRRACGRCGGRSTTSCRCSRRAAPRLWKVSTGKPTLSRRLARRATETRR